MGLFLENLTSIIRTGLPILVEVIDLVNSVIIFVSQMTLLRLLTFLFESQTVTFTVLLFWIYFFFSDVIICSTMTFPPLGNSDHVVVTVSIDFPSNSQENALFHCIAYDYSCADWDSLYDHLRYVPLEDILNLVIMLLLVKYILLGNIRSSLTHLHGFQMLVLLP